MFVFLSIAAFLAVLLHIPVKIRFVFSLEKEIFRLFIPLPFSGKLSLVKKHKSPLVPAAETISFAIRKLEIERFRLRLAAGTGDAFSDALLVAAVRICFAEFVSLFFQKLEKSDLLISVRPDFEKSCLKFDIDCIFSFRVGNIIGAILTEIISRIKKSTAERNKKHNVRTDTGYNGNNAP